MLEQVAKKAKNQLGSTTKRKEKVLFISEDYSSLAGSQLYPGFNEFEVVDDILKSCGADLGLTIKLHPKEENGKFDDLLALGYVEKCLDHNLDTLKEYKFIIGMGSMLLLKLSAYRGDIRGKALKQLDS